MVGRGLSHYKILAKKRVSREIVRALDVTLTSDEDRRLAEHPMNIRAFELYLQARQEVRGLGDFERASRLLSRAVAIEGETTPLKALMAWAKVSQVKAGINRDLRLLDEAETEARAPSWRWRRTRPTAMRCSAISSTSAATTHWRCGISGWHSIASPTMPTSLLHGQQLHRGGTKRTGR